MDSNKDVIQFQIYCWNLTSRD